MNLVPLFASRSELNQELLKDAKHRDADIVFDDEYTLDLGGVKAQDPRHGHQPHARRHRGAGRRRAVLGRRGDEAAAGLRQSRRRPSRTGWRAWTRSRP